MIVIVAFFEREVSVCACFTIKVQLSHMFLHVG